MVMELLNALGPIKLILTPPLFIKCLYQARQLSGHVFVCKGIFL
jgi:hypothetical protein